MNERERNNEDLAGIEFDKWQQEVLTHEGNITIRAGRQVGKSTVIGKKAHDFATRNPGTITLVIAASQRQSSLLFSKIRALFDDDNEERVKPFIKKLYDDKGKALTREEVSKVYKEQGIYEEQPTLTQLTLKNGSKIYCLPTGKTGVYIRGYTIDLLIADEAAYIPETVWTAIMPMIAVSRKKRGMGWLILLSTPFGKGGFYYESFTDDDFKKVHVSSENCPRIPKSFLLKEKKRMSKIEYAQEYLGEFVEEWQQFFPTNLIKKCSNFIEWSYEKEYKPSNRYWLGVDIARYGGDENAFVISEESKEGFRIIKALTTDRVSTTDTIGRIKALDDKFHFNKIIIDEGGIGGAILDHFLELPRFKRRIIGINNASRSVDADERQKRLIKEDLYSHALVLMENFAENRKPCVTMVNDNKLMRSLRSMTFEYTADKNLKIYGKYSHLAEAFVRACWGLKEKGLKLFAA